MCINIKNSVMNDNSILKRKSKKAIIKQIIVKFVMQIYIQIDKMFNFNNKIKTNTSIQLDS